MVRLLLYLACLASVVITAPMANAGAAKSFGMPVLVYHRFGPAATDSMTVTTAEFTAQVKWLNDHNHPVVPLRDLIDFLHARRPTPPPAGAVAITVDDGHKSVYEEMLPIIHQYQIPVTLFIYPSAISNASYALTWEQLRELHATGLVDIQSHTYWHPHFAREQRTSSPADYEKLVRMQLRKSKSVLESRLGIPVDMLAWPFGIHDPWLATEARKAGYLAAFTIERRHVHESEEMMALPRYLMASGHSIELLVGKIPGPIP